MAFERFETIEGTHCPFRLIRERFPVMKDKAVNRRRAHKHPNCIHWTDSGVLLELTEETRIVEVIEAVQPVLAEALSDES